MLMLRQAQLERRLRQLCGGGRGARGRLASFPAIDASIAKEAAESKSLWRQPMEGVEEAARVHAFVEHVEGAPQQRLPGIALGDEVPEQRAGGSARGKRLRGAADAKYAADEVGGEAFEADGVGGLVSLCGRRHGPALLPLSGARRGRARA